MVVRTCSPMTEPRDLDVRIVHRHIQQGRLTEQEYQAKLDALPDLESDADFVNYEQRFEEEAKHEAGPPPPVFVGASPAFAPAPAPAAESPAVPPAAEPVPPPADASPSGFEPPRPSEPAPSSGPGESDAPEERPSSGGFGTGTGWGSGGSPGGFGGSSL